MGAVVPFGSRLVRQRKAKARAEIDGLWYDDVKRSGLDTLVASGKLGYKTVDADEAWDLLHPKRAGQRPTDFDIEGYVLPYFDVDGKPLNFFRIKVLAGKWGMTEKDKKKPRYLQPTNSLPHLYIPQNYDWKRSPDGRIQVPRLVITEGEKKAAKACAVGIACVALGGVQNYQGGKHDIALLEDFDGFDLTDTAVEIAHDSDVYNSPTNRQGMQRLCYELRSRKHPKSLCTVRLTSEHAARQALDDFLAGFPDPSMAAMAYNSLPRTDDPVQDAFAVYDAELVQVRKKQTYYNLSTDTFYKGQSNVTQEYGVGLMVPNRTGNGRVLPITLWYTERKPAATTVEDVIYAPGRRMRFRRESTDRYESLNTWRPCAFTRKPRMGKTHVKPFLAFIEYLTPYLKDTQREVLLDWCAYPLQNPGKKMDFAVCMVSDAQGTGKNTLGRILRECYGDSNVAEIQGTTLTDAFNDWALKQLVIVNEVHVGVYNENVAVMKKLQTLITEDKIDVNRKYLPREKIDNYMNMYLSSNHLDALKLDTDDRRFLVVRAPDTADKWTKAQFSELNDWLEDGGYEAVYRYLLGRDLSAFNPHMDAPHTAAREVMIRGSYSQLDDVVERLLDSPDEVLGALSTPLPASELLHAQYLVEAINRYATSKNMRVNLSVAKLGTSLGKASGLRKRVVEVKLASGRRTHITLYALFNGDKWAKRTDKEWKVHWKRWAEPK